MGIGRYMAIQIFDSSSASPPCPTPTNAMEVSQGLFKTPPPKGIKKTWPRDGLQPKTFEQYQYCDKSQSFQRSWLNVVETMP